MPRSGIPARPSNAAPRLVVVHPSTDRPRSAPSAERATTWPSGVAKVRPPLHPSAPIEQCPCCCSPCWPTGRPVHVARAPVRSFALAPDPPARCVHPHSAQSAAASGLASGPPRLTRWPILTGEPHRPVVLRLPVLATAAELGRFADEDLAQLMRHQATARPGKVHRLDEVRSLQTGTAAWAGFGS